MKKLLLICLSALSIGACTRVDPGWEGIKVDMLAADRGQVYPIVTGRVWYSPYSEDIYQFPTFVQRVAWTEEEGEAITFRSKEGYSFSADVGFAFQFLKGKTPDIFVKYRREAFEIVDGPYRDIVRNAYVDAAQELAGLSILGAGMSTLNDAVKSRVTEQLKDEVSIEYVNIVGKPRVDGQVEQAINAVIQATQAANVAEENVRKVRAEAEQQKAQAEGQGQAMERMAQAKANALRIESEALQKYGTSVIEMRAIEKWNGQMPQIIGGNGAVPFINIPAGK